MDVARGVALLAMFVYHFAFDLVHFGFVGWDVVGDPRWRGFAAAIAGSFIALSGASLVLAHGEGIRWRAFARRLALLVGAAALVTAATVVAMPAAPVWFGILHAIALFSVLGLPFLRAPIAVVLAAAAVVLALPFLWRSAAFDGLAFVWLGLGERMPPMVDHEPLFPWFAATLLGIAGARIALSRALPARATRPPRRRPVRLLAVMGRNSLPIYLLHQPVFFAILIPIAWLAPPASESALLASFRAECVAACRAGGSDAAYCGAVCDCVVDGIRGAGLEGAVRAGADDPVPRMDPRIADLTRACVAREGRVLEDAPTLAPDGDAPRQDPAAPDPPGAR